MKYRKLRIAFSAVCGIVCLLLIGLWVRSYSYFDSTIANVGTQDFGLTSVKGTLTLQFYGSSQQANETLPRWRVMSIRINFYVPLIENNKSFLGFRRINWDIFSVPYWFAVVTSAALTAMPWMRWRFSLRTLLIGMTLVAGLLGLIVYAIK